MKVEYQNKDDMIARINKVTDKWIRYKYWQGWTLKSDSTALEYFLNKEVSKKCTCKCKECGFYYLNTDGEFLINQEDEKPLCGILTKEVL